ncbi:MAG: PilZ domain-containing protein [Thermoanaerobaculia bacterium]|nr:PilZ domain-containing protein [Thermoanaerobaculia bacterium]
MSPSDSLPDLLKLIDVEDLRHDQRYVVSAPLAGELLGSPATVRDLSVGGFGVSHPVHVRVGAVHPLQVRDREFGEVIPFDTTVVWSRISGERDENGTLLYTSGVRIENDPAEVAGKVGRLLHYYGKPDTESIERKRALELSRLMRRVTAERQLLLDLEPAELLLSYQALSQTQQVSETEKDDLVRGANEFLSSSARPTAWNRDVLASWQSIDRSLEIATIDAARKILVEIDRFVHGKR